MDGLDVKRLDMNSEYLGVSTLLLMENAGRSVALECSRFHRPAIFCGRGNNGGDGLVAARHMSSLGKEVTVYALEGNRSPAAQKNLDIVKNLPSIKLCLVRDASDCAKIKKDLRENDVIVDALLGAGASGTLREPVKSLVRTMNSAKAPRIAVDAPSPGLKADRTISFHFKKTPDAKAINIGIPKEAESYCGPGDVFAAIPTRSGAEHKGVFGRVLVIGGSNLYYGAPALAARAAHRTGADIVYAYVPGCVAEKMPYDLDLIVRKANSKDFLSPEDIDDLSGINFDCAVIGNGIGTRRETMEFTVEFIEKNRRPLVVDADALRLIPEKKIGKNMILTPHEAEFKTLFGEIPRELPERMKTVKEKAKKAGAIILKGPTDIISDGKTVRLNRTGNPYMTVGGTGDALAGIAGALLARADPFKAACAAAFLSGLAGDICAKEKTPFLASDMIEKIPDAIRESLSYQK